MSQPGTSFFRSIVGMFVALVVAGAVGFAPAGAVPGRQQTPPGPPQAASVPLAVPQSTPSAPSPFADVAPGHDFHAEITWLAQTGVSTGWSGPEGTRLFRPHQPVLRDQMAAFLYRMAGSPAFQPPATSPFADVPTDHDFYREISWLAHTGVSTGWSGPDGTRLFRPYQPVLRDQMAAFLHRMAGSPALDAPATSPFADVDTDHDFYPEISWLAEVGVSTGWSGPDGTRLFRSYQPVLRDQMAAFLHRLDPLLPGRNTLVAEVVSGHEAAYALRAEGTVWAWGHNDAGQLGNGTTTDSSVPVRVTGLSDVRTVAANSSSAYALKTDGTVWAWGRNGDGQLGNGTTTDSSVPVRVAGLSDVESLETSNGSSVYALTADGTVWAWGRNYTGELGNGTTTDSSVPVRVTGLPEIRSLEINLGNAYALAADGTVWAWGWNPAGQLGNGTTTDSSVPVRVTGLPEIRSLAANYASAYAVTAEGTVWAWGGNSVGQLGNGTTTNSSVPVRVTDLSGVQSLETDDKSAYALTADGTIWAWGDNFTGQLGNGTTTDSSVPVRVTGLSDVHGLETNGYSTYALTAQGALWAWGNNYVGQLGNGTTTNSSVPVRVTDLSGVQSLEMAHLSVYALTAEGAVWAWGENDLGQLGNGTTTDSSVPTQVRRLTH